MCRALEWVNAGGCASPLPAGQTMTSQQSEVPGHAGKRRFHFLAVSTETNTSLRAVVNGTWEHRSSAATCWTQYSHEGTALHPGLLHKPVLLARSTWLHSVHHVAYHQRRLRYPTPFWLPSCLRTAHYAQPSSLLCFGEVGTAIASSVPQTPSHPTLPWEIRFWTT